MAFMKYAYATIVRPHVSKTEWSNVRVASRKAAKKTQAAKVSEANLSENLVDRASEFFGTKFSPDKYLLTHATIIASVDTYSPQGVKTGSVMEDGFRVNRRFSNFRVKASADQYINNNLDCWDRKVLLSSYQTFVGGHNFVEHVQVEELSKGRIIDACARDVGDSIYVDILIATDRKHADLVAAIESGNMGTLSMGCTVDGTICTKCGHWAADETEMCPHIKYAKGNKFFDEQGTQHRVAELCGHESLGPTGGVHFIEASWVGTPAFTGAVLRNVLEPTEEIRRKAQKVLNTPPTQWTDSDVLKAASLSTSAQQDSRVVGRVLAPTKESFTLGSRPRVARDDFFAGWDDAEGGDDAEAAPAAPAAPASPMKDVEDDVYNYVMDRVKTRVRNDLSSQDAKADAKGTSSTNETLVKQAATARKAYKAGLGEITRTASSDAELIDRVAAFNSQVGIDIPVDVYRTILRVGHCDKYGSVDAFIRACGQTMGHKPSMGEAKTLVRLGTLLSQGRSLRKFGI